MTAIDQSLTRASLELVAGDGCWSVVDPATVLTRLWYFDGKFLRAEGFRRDQEYVRSLVAVSNQATGHGVVHGFTASKGPGDTVRVEPGLALAPSGRPLLLTSRQDLPTATLVARATGGSAGRASGAFRPDPEFGLCPPDAGQPPDVSSGAGVMWVLYARPVEALCGEEERFGQLCEDACATETDRSVVVEGVCFFVERLDLALPTSSAVTFDGRHLRSRYASAYYGWERSRTASLISGSGLRSPIWCRGAEGVSGDAVALAVFDRAGGVTSFVDAWTARRELMEPSPSRYWAWRMARRPRDVFFAQVLQFQCQLLELAVAPGDQPGACEDEREVLSVADEMLRALTAAFEKSESREPIAEDVGAVASNLRAVVGAEAYTRIAALQRHVALVLGRGGRAATGSLLLDRAIMQLPPCGYLPVDPARRLQDQVRAFMGPGVDLRFCAVRPDFVGEAFEEAQHMDRISLTQGIDDPGNLEEVDILVPGGRIEEEKAERSAVFQGRLAVRPQIRVEDEKATTGAALTLSTVAREHAGDTWSWVLAGVGESPANLAVGLLFAALLVDAGIDAQKVADAGAPVDEGVEVPFVSDERHEARLSDPGFIQRVGRERHFARARRARTASLADEGIEDLAAAVGPDRKVGRDEDRPLALWFDIEISRPLTSLSRGETAPASMRLAVYSRAKEQPVLADYRVNGTLSVDDIVSGSAGGAVPEAVTIVSTLRGQADPLIVVGTHTVDQPAAAFTDMQLTWRVGRASTGAKVMLVAVGPPVSEGRRVQPTISARDEGKPRRVEARASLTLRGPSAVTVRADVVAPVGQETQTYELARLDLDELADGFGQSSAARTVAESAIEMIAAELSLPGRDPSFAATARHRMLGSDAAAEVHEHVVGVADWVFFHRRRTKRCARDVVTPVGVRRYRLHHAVIDDLSDLRRFEALSGVHARTADELPGFEVGNIAARVRERSDLDYAHAFLPVSGLGFRAVATLEFEAQTSRMLTPTSVLRNAWQAADRGTHLLLAAAGDIGRGDGEDVALGRLASARGAIADLIDQSRVRVVHLATIPPEFQESGLDGALFTVGFRREEPAVGGCITLLRLSPEAIEVLAKVFGDDLGDVTLDQILALLEKHQIPADAFTATFDDGRAFLNDTAVKHWWGPIPPARAVHLLGAAAAGAGEEDLWRDRSLVTTEALGLASLGHEATIGDTGDCGSVLMLTTSELRNVAVGFVRG